MKIMWQGTFFAAMALTPLAALSLFYYARYLTKVGFPTKTPVYLRTCSWILVMLFLSGFTIVLKKEIPVKGATVIALDGSQSMRMNDGKNSARLSRALSDIETFVKSYGYEEDIYVISDELEKTERATISELMFAGPDTLLADGLDKIISHNDITDILLFTDGNDTGGYDDSSMKTGVKVHAIMYGGEDNQKNVGVGDIKAPEFGIVGTDISVNAEIYFSGIPDGESVGVELFEDNERISQETIKSSGEDFTAAAVSFKYVPKAVGEKTIQVIAKLENGEQETADNSRAAFVEVISDKKSILYIDSPGWDFRFISEYLKGLEKIDYEYILLGPGGIIDGSAQRGVLSKSSVLSKYKLIIAGNASPYLSHSERTVLKEYVSAGGNLVALGGDRSLFTAGNEWVAILGQSSLYGDKEGFEVTLTNDGNASALLNFHSGDDCWKQFPFIKTFNKINSSSGIETLAVHPWLKCGSSLCPLIFTKEHNRGHIIAFAFQSQWRWRFSESTSVCYENMWTNIITETAGAEKKPAIQIFADKKVVPLGKKVRMNININDDVDNGTIKLILNNGANTELMSEISVTPDASKYEYIFAPSNEGVYSFTVEYNGSTSEAANVYVHVSKNEYAKMGRSSRFVDLIQKNGGKIFNDGDVESAVKYLKENVEYEQFTSPYRPWTKWPFLLAIIIFLTLEWVVRRRGGLT